MNTRQNLWTRVVNPAAMAGVIAVVLLAGMAAAPDPTRKAGNPEVKTISAADLRGLLAQARGTATLVHVWATWCPPCREEFPNIVRFQKAYASHGIELILVSADASTKPEPIVDFLAKQGVAFPSYVIANPDAVFIDALCTNWTGALPGSFFFDANGKLRQWWEGKADYEQYVKAADSVLKQTKQTEARP